MRSPLSRLKGSNTACLTLLVYIFMPIMSFLHNFIERKKFKFPAPIPSVAILVKKGGRQSAVYDVILAPERVPENALPT